MMFQGATVTWRSWLRRLYKGNAPEAHRFRYMFLLFDLATLGFIAATSFLDRSETIEKLGIAIGSVILLDLCARLAISKNKLRHLLHPTSLIDLVAVVSFFAPISGEGGAFLRIVRTLRLFRSYQMLARLRVDSRFFARNEEVVLSLINLFVFVFVTTGIVYQT